MKVYFRLHIVKYLRIRMMPSNLADFIFRPQPLHYVFPASAHPEVYVPALPSQWMRIQYRHPYSLQNTRMKTSSQEYICQLTCSFLMQLIRCLCDLCESNPLKQHFFFWPLFRRQPFQAVLHHPTDCLPFTLIQQRNPLFRIKHARQFISRSQ